MDNREAIEWLKGCVVAYEVDSNGKPDGNVTCELKQEVIDMAISALEKQEQDRWVPVSERPKKDGRYQVTRLDYVTDTKFIDNLWYEKNTWWNRQATGDYAVTAWRPLPEPYTEEEA